MRKQRPIPEFASLTSQQRSRLFEWFEQGHAYDDLRRMIARPAPEGFGLQVSRAKIYRYYHQWRQIREAREADQTITPELWNAVANGDPVELQAQTWTAVQAQIALNLERERITPGELLQLMRVATFEEDKARADRYLEIRKTYERVRQGYLEMAREQAALKEELRRARELKRQPQTPPLWRSH